ncbi:MAG TPA: NAD(P)/FAD-dependent oxidoreductase [Rhizomicrobium sp.]|jgi:phytoene dehydrogenase-like protein|nr:NAD(P)/FAD-dependent oxidoreductase [Rhizomicrobium sp.]
MSDSYDAIIIGAGVNGLTAAAYLARAGKQVLVVEGASQTGGLSQSVPLADGYLSPQVAHTFYAIDTKLLRDFRKVRNGLLFASRDIPLAGIGEDGAPLVLSRDGFASAASISLHSQHDAEAWGRFRAEQFALARALRPLWWKEKRFELSRLSRKHQQLLSTLQSASAVAWLDNWFESDLLKATLALDATEMSPLEPGSALPLLWRAAQEMCGFQGAVAVPRRGPGALIRLLAGAAATAGTTIRTNVRAERLLIDEHGVAGVELPFREVVRASTVLSSLSRRETLLDLVGEALPFAEARRLERGDRKTGAALVTLLLNDAPNFGGGHMPREARFATAGRMETVIAADTEARAGKLPDDLVFETLVSSEADTTLAPPGKHVVTCLVRPVPLAPAEGWNVLTPRLTAKIISTLDKLSPGLVPTIVSVHAATPDVLPGHDDALTPGRMLAQWRERIRTVVPGLYLCGAAAEPVGAVSGRAGRIAAAIAMEGR